MESIKQKLLGWLKTPLAILVALGTLVVLYIKYLRGKNSELEAGAETAESKKVDAVLAQQQADLKAQHDADIAKLEADKGRKLSDQEMTDFLKKL